MSLIRRGPAQIRVATTRSGEEKPDLARTSLDLASGCGGEDELDAGRGEAILRASSALVPWELT